MLYRVIVIAFVIFAPISALFAQSVTVAELIPHQLWNYVDYNEYDTASAGAAPAKSHASYTINAIDTSTAVISALDSIGGGDPSGIHELNYYFLTSDDLQVYADTNFIDAFIPSDVAEGVSKAPDVWVDYIKSSAGVGTSYPITVLNSVVMDGGTKLNVTVTLTGMYMGIDTVIASGITYDSAYRFDITAVTDLYVGPIKAGSLTETQSDWLVREIGFVKTNEPIASTTIDGSTITSGGRETEMTTYGIATPPSIVSAPYSASGISFFPDPASNQVTLSFDRPPNQIFLYNDAGQMVRSFQISSYSSNALLWVQDIPNGAYLMQVMFSDGTGESQRLIVDH